ncbi:MAG: T9SS type A sorting domain-containing protein [Ignavibacteriales bacterium]|nr:T9SS type A sorting domain-containing protein [Ignavibacteriales bacterium]
MKKIILLSLLWALAAAGATMPAGSIYFVLGSDTSNLDGLTVGKYHCCFTFPMYTDPAQTIATVMSDVYRGKLRDSYGSPIRFTWWMMGGNMFRFADNMNVPLNNTMTMHQMKRYHGNAIQKYGDELSLHYHTFTWTDYDGDGVYYWNQAHNFSECRSDFDATMAQYLLEENVYPVAFRSGWHYMDNEWQRLLNERLPYSLHDDYPAKRVTTVEPIDNVYDWSLSSSEFVPFHPSTANYQLAGNSKGWNNRSIHIASVTQAMVDTIFAKAKRGADQVVCFWGHLAEAEFPKNMIKIDSLAHIAAKKFPDVSFRYSTGTEAMQRWRGRTDSIPPVVIFTEERGGDRVSFTVTSSEPIFQSQPFIAVKNVNEESIIASCHPVGVNAWKTDSSFTIGQLAKAAVAVTDTMGNLATRFLRYLPDDLYIDNADSTYYESRGAWTSVSSQSCWGTTYRSAVLPPNDSAVVGWKWTVPQTGAYSIVIQNPSAANAVERTLYRLKRNGLVVDTLSMMQPARAGQWTLLFSRNLTSADNVSVELVGYTQSQAGKTLSADVLKVTALVRLRQLVVAKDFIDLGICSSTDTVKFSLTLSNNGIQPLTVSAIHSMGGSIRPVEMLPFQIPAFGIKDVSLVFVCPAKKLVLDTLVISSDDPSTPARAIPVAATVETYLRVADNEDPSAYAETGVWFTSVAWANGNSSRCVYISTAKGAMATFKRTLQLEGWYRVEEIVPKTVNASMYARYVLLTNGARVDSIVIDQNVNSQSWVSLFRRKFGANTEAEVRVSDVTESVAGSALVLRADAVRFFYVDTLTMGLSIGTDGVPKTYALEQNYPNPFNPVTTIQFALPVNAEVSLNVYNVLGQQVAALVNGQLAAGMHAVVFDAPALASGIYFYTLNVRGTDGSEFNSVKKLILLR